MRDFVEIWGTCSLLRIDPDAGICDDGAGLGIDLELFGDELEDCQERGCFRD